MLKNNVPINRRFAVVVLLLTFAALSGFSAFSTYRIAKRSSQDSLKSTAYFIGITLDQALNLSGLDEGLIADIMKRQARETIAYIALYDRNGRILLHSNPRLIGQSDKRPFIHDIISSGAPDSFYTTLKTGESVYVMNMPIRAQSPMVLSIALHTYPSMEAVRGAHLHLTILLIVNAAVWCMAFAFLYYMKKVDALQRTAREKERFAVLGEMASVVAHEIRTPLSAIKGFAQYIREGLKDGDKTSEGLDVIVSESKRLERLTNDLLDYARPQELKITTLPIEQLIDDAVGVAVHDDGITVERHISLVKGTIDSDGEKIKQILINILSNAVDSESDTIQIAVEEGKKTVTITISDAGKGMDTDMLQQARRPFFTTKPRGTGLGLPIVENIVSALGGTISIESRLGQGTAVTVTLPLLRIK